LYERVIDCLDINKGELLLLALFILLVCLVWAYDSARYYARIRVIRIGKYRLIKKIR